MMILLIWLLVFVATVILYFRQTYSRFSKYGVKNFTTIPLLGNMHRILFRVDHIVDDIERLYKGFPGERFVGKFEFTTPVVQIHDLELAKRIAVKDFEYFLDHRLIVNKDNDVLFGRNLMSLTGQEWKDMRSTLSPAFTSSKIRLMVSFMEEVGQQMTKALKQKIIDSGSDAIVIDVKDLTTRYANDVIASCAFGLKVDSHTNETNQFYEQGKAATTFSFKQIFIFFGYVSLPKLMDKLRVSLFPEVTKEFFRNLVLNTMEERESHNVIRPDMIHLLMQAKKGQLSHDDKKAVDADAGFATVEESIVGKEDVNRAWSDNDLVAQAVIFFFAGFEGISSIMSFLFYELALNPEVQGKLAQEIRETDAKNNGKVDYNSIQQMTYMDMVISELLRLWAPAAMLDRRCNKDYNLGKPNDKATEDFIIRKGEGIHIPVWAIHRDPEFFPDPLNFDPERFSEGNKHNIKPNTYMPFGLGPRNCIGSRFALCELKVMVYQTLQHFEVAPCAMTTVPAKLAKNSFNLRMEGGHWLKIRVRI